MTSAVQPPLYVNTTSYTSDADEQNLIDLVTNALIPDSSASPPLTERYIYRLDTKEKYSVIGDLGRGSKGHVVQVLLPNGSTAAIKICAKPFDKEAEILARAKQEQVPNIVDYQDHFKLRDESGNFSYGLQMNVLPPDTYEMFISSGDIENTSASIILNWAKDGLNALARLHELGIAHLGLKPENMAVNLDKKLILLDFGLARWIKNIRWEERVGTMSYHAPEMILRSDYGPAVDIWGLAVALFALYTGCPLIPVADLGDLEQEFADCLHLMEIIIGHPDTNFFQLGPRRVSLFLGVLTPRGLSEESQHNLNFYYEIRDSFPNMPIWQGCILQAAAEKKDGMDKVNTLIFLLSKMLRYEHRITAADALKLFFHEQTESKRE